MKNSKRKIISYALTISMLFSAANQERKMEPAILPEKITLEEVKEEDKKLKAHIEEHDNAIKGVNIVAKRAKIKENNDYDLLEKDIKLKDVKENVHYCEVCGNFTDGDVCNICETRDNSVITDFKENKFLAD